MTMYAKVVNGEVVSFPYERPELQADNPNTVFPADLSAVDLSEFGVVNVEATEPPAPNAIPYAKRLEGGWIQAWTVP